MSIEIISLIISGLILAVLFTVMMFFVWNMGELSTALSLSTKVHEEGFMVKVPEKSMTMQQGALSSVSIKWIAAQLQSTVTALARDASECDDQFQTLQDETDDFDAPPSCASTAITKSLKHDYPIMGTVYKTANRMNDTFYVPDLTKGKQNSSPDDERCKVSAHKSDNDVQQSGDGLLLKGNPMKRTSCVCGPPPFGPDNYPRYYGLAWQLDHDWRTSTAATNWDNNYFQNYLQPPTGTQNNAGNSHISATGDTIAGVAQTLTAACATYGTSEQQDSCNDASDGFNFVNGLWQNMKTDSSPLVSKVEPVSDMRYKTREQFIGAAVCDSVTDDIPTSQLMTAAEGKFWYDKCYDAVWKHPTRSDAFSANGLLHLAETNGLDMASFSDTATDAVVSEGITQLKTLVCQGSLPGTLYSHDTYLPWRNPKDNFRVKACTPDPDGSGKSKDCPKISFSKCAPWRQSHTVCVGQNYDPSAILDLPTTDIHPLAHDGDILVPPFKCGTNHGIEGGKGNCPTDPP